MVFSFLRKYSGIAVTAILVGGIYFFLSASILSVALAQNENVTPAQQAQFQYYVDRANNYKEKGKLKKTIKAYRNALNSMDHPIIRLEIVRSLALFYGASKEAETFTHCQILAQQGYAFLSKFCSASYSLQIFQNGLYSGARNFRKGAPYLGRAFNDLSLVIENFQGLALLNEKENQDLHRDSLKKFATILLYYDNASRALVYLNRAKVLTPEGEDTELLTLEASALSKQERFSESEMMLRNLIEQKISFPETSSYLQKAKINSYNNILAYTLVRQGKYAEALYIFDRFEDKSFTKFYIEIPFYAAVAALELGRYDQAIKYIAWTAERKRNLATGGKRAFHFEKPDMYSQPVSQDLILTVHGKILVGQGRYNEATQLSPNNPVYIASLNQNTPVIELVTGQAETRFEESPQINQGDKAPRAVNVPQVNPKPVSAKRPGWIGIGMAGTTVNLVDNKTGVERSEKAILVTGVVKDGPADLAGIIKGDKIISGYGVKFWATPAEFGEVVKDAEINYRFIVVLVRNNLRELITVDTLVIGAKDQSVQFRKALFAHWNREPDKAAYLMLAEAGRGNYEAQYWMGVIYGFQENDEEALKWYLAAAEQGYVEAQYRVGVWYDLGIGTSKDEVASAKWTLLAAEQGHGLAQSDMVVKYGSGKGVPQDKFEAFKWQLMAAEGGSSVYQNAVGRAYETGYGVPEDKEEAVRWYRRAADNGNSSAPYNLGKLYESGEGVGYQSYTQAATWYKKAAEGGDLSAPERLGEMYQQGLGVPENYVIAFMWFNLVAARGFESAKEKRDLLREKMTPDQIAEGQRLSQEWFEEHQ